MEEENNQDPGGELFKKPKEKEEQTLVQMLQKNRAAALSFAVLIAANALLSSCAPQAKNPASAIMAKTYQMNVEKDEGSLDERGTFYCGNDSTGYHSYYLWGGRAILPPTSTAPHSGTGHYGHSYYHPHYRSVYYHSSGWGVAPASFAAGGYAVTRGGTIGG